MAKSSYAKKWRLSSEKPLRAQAATTIDQFSSLIGLAKAHISNPEVRILLTQFQRDLFVIGAELAEPVIQSRRIRQRSPKVTLDMVRKVERIEDEVLKKLPMPRAFVIPGGSVEASYLDAARSVGKSAQVLLIRLVEDDSLNPLTVEYVNEVSYILFLLARLMNRQNNVPEEEWHGSIGDSKA